MVKNNQRPDRAGNKKAGNAPELSPEEKRAELARQLRLKPKSKATLDELIDNPDISLTDAYIKHHKTNSRVTAATEASKLARKPQSRIYTAAAVGKAKRRIVELVDSGNESIALKAAQDVVDRTEGKAIQKNETTSKVVTVKLDLSGVRIGAHYLQPEQLPTIVEEATS